MTSSAPTSSAVPAAALSAGPLLHQPAPAGVTLAGVSPAALQASYQHCRRVTRAAARNFYYGLRLTPEPRRSAVFAMYAWMRTGDDIVDAQGTQHFKSDLFAAFKRLTWQVIAGDLSETDRCDCGPKGGVTFWPAFAHTVGTYGISREIIAAMLAGLQADLEHTPLVANGDLERYCDQVGSSVGLACVRSWGLRPGASAAIVTEKGIARGRAFQL
ncbi:MAG: squalene/phytoene synthase family protein, partial [Planctomycetaceae bacterium]|nr:squalene/phytoene synthase family protein [Planctomycetaceae bacterium]